MGREVPESLGQAPRPPLHQHPQQQVRRRFQEEEHDRGQAGKVSYHVIMRSMEFCGRTTPYIIGSDWMHLIIGLGHVKMWSFWVVRATNSSAAVV